MSSSSTVKKQHQLAVTENASLSVYSQSDLGVRCCITSTVKNMTESLDKSGDNEDF